MARRAKVPAESPSVLRLVGAVREELMAQESNGLETLDVSRALGARGRLLGAEAVFAAADSVDAHVRGFGVLQPLVDDPGVTDVLVNAPDDVWTDGVGGLKRSGVVFESEEEVRRLAGRLMALGGRRIDDAQPSGDARVGRGRVHVVIPPLSGRGTLLSIRITRGQCAGLDDFLDSGPQGELALAVLRGMVTSRCNFLISGGTGSGKTTLLRGLLGEARPDERIMIVEDSPELEPEHPHVVSLQTRPANAEGEGEYDLAALLRQAMRMRPDRIVVGECRGAEVRELLAAMNTGHSGSAGTVHANSISAVPARLQAMGALGGLSPAATDAQMASAVEVLVHVERTRDGRRIAEIGVLERGPHGITVVSGLTRSSGGWRRGDGFGKMAARCGIPVEVALGAGSARIEQGAAGLGQGSGGLGLGLER